MGFSKMIAGPQHRLPATCRFVAEGLRRGVNRGQRRQQDGEGELGVSYVMSSAFIGFGAKAIRHKPVGAVTFPLPIGRPPDMVSVGSRLVMADPLCPTKYIERMGTGTGDRFKRCRKAGLPEPEFILTDGFVITIRRVPKRAFAFHRRTAFSEG